VKKTSIAGCLVLLLAMLCPNLHTHPADGDDPEIVVHSHAAAIAEHHLSRNGSAFEAADDHLKAFHLSTYLLATKDYGFSVALPSRHVEFVPQFVLLGSSSLIEQRSHDPPVISSTQPRSPPA
jgi:hypothetical protein